MREMKKMGIGGISGGNGVSLITEGDVFFQQYNIFNRKREKEYQP